MGSTALQLVQRLCSHLRVERVGWGRMESMRDNGICVAGGSDGKRLCREFGFECVAAGVQESHSGGKK